MNMTNPNDPASPILSESLASLPGASCAGLTKREYLFALNHAAILRAAAFNQGAEDMLINAGVKSADFAEFIARLAADVTDAGIAALNAE
jgi:hypothetical protein